MSGVDVRGIPRALLAGSNAARERLTRWDDDIRLPTGAARRIGFVQLDRAVGATTLAREVIRVLALRRDRAPLAIDVASSGALAGRLGAGEASPHPDRNRARTSADAVVGLDRSSDGTWVIRPAGADADPVGAWIDEAGPVVRFFDVAVTDFGARHPNGDLAAASSLCDAVCLVSSAERAAAELADSVLQAITALPEHPRIVLALTDLGAPPRRAPEVVAAHAARTVVRIPRDRGLAVGAPARSLAAGDAVLALSAALMAEGPS